jgi:uncharacterized repeat protein (TIGR02543 family)
MYEVKFESMGGSQVDAIDLEDGKTIPVPEVTREGYTLEGWYTSFDDGETFDSKWSFMSDSPISDLILYANWTLIEYEISYDVNGGTNETNPKTYTIETETITLDNPTKEGHTFDGWYENPEHNGEPITEISLGSTGDRNLYAKWLLEGLEFDSESGTITDYTGIAKDIIIPSVINDVIVTTIGDTAFYSKDLTSVTIPDSITTIGNHAFGDNELTNLTIPESVTTIGSLAFSDNQLTSVTIPASVTTIGLGVFSRNNLAIVIIPDSVTTIGSLAFSNNQLTSITIPESVTAIERSAFAKNDLESITILGDGSRFNLEWVRIGFPAPLQPGVINENGFIFHSETNTITDYIGNNKDIMIPSEINGVPVIKIGYSAFLDNGLTSVTIPDSVTFIDERAFFYNDLSSIIIPSSVTIIGESAFKYNDFSSIEILGDETRFNDIWSDIGFSERLKPES